MDVEKKISCSLDDLIKMQRRKPPPTNVGGTPKKSRSVSRRLDSRPARQRKAPAPWKGGKGMQSGVQSGALQEQRPLSGMKQMRQKQRHMQRQQRQRGLQRQQSSETSKQQRQRGINEYINAPLNTYVSSKQAKQQRHGQRETKHGVFATPRKLLGRKQSKRVAPMASDSAPVARSIAPKNKIITSRMATASDATSRKVSVRTRKPPVFKSAMRRSRSSPKETTAAASGSSKRAKSLVSSQKTGSKRVQLRQGPARQGVRVNMSLGRFRGSAGSRVRSQPGVSLMSRVSRAPAGPVLTSAASHYGAGSKTKQTQVVYRGPSRSSLRSSEALSSTASAARHDEELLSKIKIMTSLESVPPPLQQQRGAPVAFPSAMRDQHAVPAPVEVATDSQKIGTLSSRFAY